MVLLRPPPELPLQTALNRTGCSAQIVIAILSLCDDYRGRNQSSSDRLFYRIVLLGARILSSSLPARRLLSRWRLSPRRSSGLPLTASGALDATSFDAGRAGPTPSLKLSPSTTLGVSSRPLISLSTTPSLEHSEPRWRLSTTTPSPSTERRLPLSHPATRSPSLGRPWRLTL